MRDKPAVSEETIVSSLRRHYGLTVTALAFLPLGFDSDTWVYRVEGDGGAVYFLKLKRLIAGDLLDLVTALPRALRDAGISEVIAPLPTRDGALHATAGDFKVLLYPFVEGQSGWECGLSLRQWRAFGATLARIHATMPAAPLAERLPRETFMPSPRWSGIVRDLLARGVPGEVDAWTVALAAFMRERQAEIRHIVRRTEALGRALRRRHDPFVLCHGDIHVGNLLLDAAGDLTIVDWDQPLLAPRERDLMFVLGGALRGAPPGSPEETAFFAGYGEITPDPLALAFYQYDWALQDIGSFAADVVARPGASVATRQEALDYLHAVFAPGQIAEVARLTEQTLPPSLLG